MTAIVGMVWNDGSVWIAGDSAGVDGHYQLMVRRDPKVFRRGDLVIGFTTSYRFGQVLRFASRMPKSTAKRWTRHPGKYLIQAWVPWARKSLDDAGWLKKRDEREEAGQLLVAVGGRLFCIDSDWQVGETISGPMAIGAGGALALGATVALLRHAVRLKRRPQDILAESLLVAEQHCAMVRRPWVMESNGEDGNGKTIRSR